MPYGAAYTVHDTLTLKSSHAEAIVRVVETAIDVGRRYQFFVWSQSHLQVLLPHKLAVCGAYQRNRKELQFELFNSVALPEVVLDALVDGHGLLIQQVVGAWVDRQGRSLAINVSQLEGEIFAEVRLALLGAGLDELLVHGVSRPQRPRELESLFIFASPGQCSSTQQRMYLDLLLPHLHATWLRVQAVEREMKEAPPSARVTSGQTRAVVTERERQILGWMREGMSNQQIGEVLGISPLTVKNHVHKILHKLNANNRAQAVACAMSMNLLGRSRNDGGAP